MSATLVVGETAGAASVAVPTSLHRIWGHVDAYCGAHDHLLHPGGLISTPLPRTLLSATPGPIPHVWGGGNLCVVGSLATGVHEIPSTGWLR